MGRFARLAPTLCVCVLAAGYLGWIFIHAGGDPLVFATLGTRFLVPDPAGTEGYDGQFNYYIARGSNPQSAVPHLDIPAYRFQRILYPLAARGLALGNPDVIPWTLIGINLACLGAITFLAGELLAQRGRSRWAALIVGLWAGLIGAVRLDLAEPLALFLVVLALWVSGPRLDQRILPVTLLLALSLLTKEIAVPFIAGWFAWLIYQRRFRSAAILFTALLPYAALQIGLWSAFGTPGIFSGSAEATSFEWIPFAGLIQVAEISLPALAVLFFVYLPGLLFPALFGMTAPLVDFIRRRMQPESLLLFANAWMIAMAPYFVFREPLGILRLASGLILCMWLYAAAKRIIWWNALGLAGLAYLVFLR